MSTRLPLVYIAGSSHSGSTLLDLLLGSHPAIESVGEAKKISSVSDAIRAGEEPLCTCRQTVADCTFWRSVMPARPEELKTDAEANAELFRRTLAARGRQVALDSSKSPGRARLLARSQLFDLTIIHLVRDSRAIAHSNLRKHSRTSGRDRDRYQITASARGWLKLNMRIRRLFEHAPGVRYVTLRYEDLTTDPARTLRALLLSLGLPWDETLLNFRQHIHHNIEGNRMRLGSQSTIRSDDEYLHASSGATWWWTTALSWNGLRVFGYPLKRSPVVPVRAGGLTPSLS